MIRSVRQAIIDLGREELNDPTANIPAKFEALIDEAERDLTDSNFADEAVHNAFSIHLQLRNNERRIEILQTYLGKGLSPEEEAWARWNLVDGLALARRCDEVVSAHIDFFEWAKTNIDPEEWLWVMYDGTQALCWFRAGDGDEWLDIYHDLIASVPPTEANRYDRFLYHRTACLALSANGRPTDAVPIGKTITDIGNENPDWPYAFYVKANGYTYLAEAYSALGQIGEFQAVVDRTNSLLSEFAESLPRPEEIGELPLLVPKLADPMNQMRHSNEHQQLDPILAYRGACHNLGAVLYRAKEYNLAARQFEAAMSYKFLSQYLAKCYAASLWMTTHDRERLDEFIGRASPAFGSNDNWWKTIPELHELANQREGV